jgi:predicted 3-demethylubiquinone-9 3-methyltransferase (glyoxalase superfamily)
MPKITNCLWFDGQAEDAANAYVAIFPNSRIGRVSRYPENMPGNLAGKVLTVEFQLDGVAFTGLNGGPQFPFTEAVSFQIDCQDQAEVDRYWTALLADGGRESQCGWLKDRFGLSWQVVPSCLAELMSDDDKAKVGRVTAAMMKMVKLDIAALEAAAG